MISKNDIYANGISGIWDLKLAAPIGEQQVRLEIVQDGDRFTGTATQGRETVPMLDCWLQDQQAKWHQHVTKPFPLNISFELTFTGDRVFGMCKPGIFPKVKVSGQRVLA